MSYLHDLAKSGHEAQRERPGGRLEGYRPIRSGWISGSQGIQVDKLVWLVALCCAVLLLFAPLSPRDTWVNVGADVRGEAASVSTGRAWAFVVGLAGIVAICSLAIGALTRQKLFLPLLCSAVTAVAFGMAALSCWYEFSDRRKWSASLPDYMLSATGWADTFVVIAFVGIVGSIGLTIRWLKPAHDDR